MVALFGSHKKKKKDVVSYGTHMLSYGCLDNVKSSPAYKLQFSIGKMTMYT